MSSEGLFRRWLRAQNLACADRVFFAVPEQDNPDFPFVTLARTGGAPDEYRRETMTFRLEAWAANKYDADALATALSLAVNGLQAPDYDTYSAAEGVINGGGVTAMAPAPGAASGSRAAKRYVLFGWLSTQLT